MSRQNQTALGFSLIELMVSLSIMAIVTAQILLSFSSQHRNFIEQEQVIATQQDVRLVADVIVSDIRMAGYMFDDGLAVGSIDGDTTAPDVLCMSDPDAIDDAIAIAAGERLEGADIAGALSSGNTGLTLAASQLDVDEDGDDDFEVGGGVLISDGTRVHCARITAISDPNITFTPAIQTGASFSQFDSMAVPAVIYQVRDGNFYRNDLMVSSHVEDLQVRFGIDDDENNSVDPGEFPVDEIGAGHNLEQIRTAQIILTSRSSREHPTHTGNRTAAANRVAGTTDKYKRRRVTVDVALRNVR
jgi:prepilin-type N-terminal cleavage/methylation domain-containing protein